MDGRSLTVFAAAAAIGASFYVFLTPDGKKKKGVKRGKCKIVWQSCVAPLSDAASTLMRDNRLTVSFENTSHHHLFSLAFACGFVDFLKMKAIIYYYSFKIFLRFWLIFIPWLILHNQPALTKFRRGLDCNTCIASLMRSIYYSDVNDHILQIIHNCHHARRVQQCSSFYMCTELKKIQKYITVIYNHQIFMIYI